MVFVLILVVYLLLEKTAMRQTLFEESLDGITIDRVIRDYEYTMPTKHFHDEYEIYYLVEGERFYFIGQHTYHIKKGCLVFINRNEIHKTGVAASSYHDRILIEFSEEPFASFFSQFGDLSLRDFFNRYSGVLEIAPAEQPFVENLLLELQSEIHHKLPGYRLSVMMKLSSLILYAMRYAESHRQMPVKSSSMARHQKVDLVADYITSHCTESISLENLADTFFVNKCYLSRIFKEVTGFTVNEYINIHRIDKAHVLLTTTSMSVSDIARECGYESLTYFEKVFRTYREVSPLKYRAKYKNSTSKRITKGDDVG